MIEVCMAWAGITVDAAMLASTVRVNGPVKRNIGRAVSRNDGSGGFRMHHGARRLRRFLLRLGVGPIVDDRRSFELLEAGRAIRNAAPSLE